MALFGVLMLGYGILLCLLESFRWYRLSWLICGAGLLLSSSIFPFHMPVFLVSLFQIMSVLIVIVIAVFHFLNIIALEERISDDASVIIVLGCKVGSRGFHFRSEATVKYLKENPRCVVICSGAQGSDEPCTEAEQFAREIEEAGIESRRIMQERESYSTKQNIENSRELIIIKDKPVGIVTSEYHMFRSLCIARTAGLNSAFGISAGSVAFYVPDYTLREAMAFVKGVVQGEIKLSVLNTRI